MSSVRPSPSHKSTRRDRRDGLQKTRFVGERTAFCISDALACGKTEAGIKMNTFQSIKGECLHAKSRSHETSDAYARVIARPDIRHRVIVCKGNHQWILQRRENASGEWPWRSLRYHRTRDALIEASRAFCERVDPNAMAILAALPASFGGVT